MNKPNATSKVSSSAKQQANAIYLQLDQCLKANSYPGPNPEALQEMRSLGLKLNQVPIPLIAEKVGILLSWAAILYSPRKHAAWDNPTESGADRVYHFMLCDLARIKSIIDRISDDS